MAQLASAALVLVYILEILVVFLLVIYYCLLVVVVMCTKLAIGQVATIALVVLLLMKLGT